MTWRLSSRGKPLLLALSLSSTPVAANQLDQTRLGLAIAGAHCLMNAPVVDIYGGDVSRETIANLSGLSVDQIAEWGAARHAVFDIAAEVLHSSGEPLRDPPEPFLTILRQAQADCQRAITFRNILDRDLAREGLTLAELEELPITVTSDDVSAMLLTARLRDLQEVLFHAKDASILGYEAQVLALARALAERPISFTDIREITTRDAAWLRARELVGLP